MRNILALFCIFMFVCGTALCEEPVFNFDFNNTTYINGMIDGITLAGIYADGYIHKNMTKYIDTCLYIMEFNETIGKKLLKVV